MAFTDLFKLCLQLYPADFRNEFSSEMLDTFSDRLNDTDSQLQAMRIIIQELFNVSWNAIVQHINQQKRIYATLPRDMKDIVQARWIIRFASLLNVLFFIIVSLESFIDTPRPETMLMPILFGTQFACVLFALKWERIGGIIMLTTTLTIATIMFMSIALPGLEPIAFISAILWGLPFAGFATAYLVIGQRQFHFQQRAMS